jgi:hypothetical protein
MKNRYLLLLFCLLIHFSAQAQDLGVSLSAGLRKTFKISKKFSVDARQQFQLNPEIERYDNRFGDFFNEDGFWPIPDRYRDDDEFDEDDADDDLPDGAGNGIPDNNSGLNDQPYSIEFDWRTNSALQANYRFFPWLRANAGYALTFDSEEFRHTFRVETAYYPLRHNKEKRKLDLITRLLYQQIGNPDDGVYEWNGALTPRADVEWTFKKNHLLQFSNALNGAWDDKTFEFERWRSNLSLIFTYNKIHRFTLGYQFQQRLGRSRYTQGISFGYEVRL